MLEQVSADNDLSQKRGISLPSFLFVLQTQLQFVDESAL